MTFEDAKDALTTAADHAPADMGRAIRGSAQTAVRTIQDRWPVLTGYSQARWAATSAPNEGAAITNSAAYAGDVHDGLADRLVPAVLAEQEAATVAEIEATITPRFEG
ncbi:MAG: hypothetical protein ACTSWM_02145 [Alphaproteobacteria bacterium]